MCNENSERYTLRVRRSLDAMTDDRADIPILHAVFEVVTDSSGKMDDDLASSTQSADDGRFFPLEMNFAGATLRHMQRLDEGVIVEVDGVVAAETANGGMYLAIFLKTKNAIAAQGNGHVLNASRQSLVHVLDFKGTPLRYGENG